MREGEVEENSSEGVIEGKRVGGRDCGRKGESG